MKQGRSIQSLAQEVLRREQSKHDYMVGSEHLTITPELQLAIPNTGEFPLTDYAHGQLAEFTDIPKKFYDRLRTAAPHLLSANANFFLRSEAKPRLVRTMDGSARAFLSNKFRRIDHYELLEAILPRIIGDSSLMVMSCEITETRLYLKIVRPSTEARITLHDPVHAGFTLQNSEIGAGSVSVQPFITVLACTNGMTVDKFGQRRAHIGRTTEATESYEIYTDETLLLDQKAFLSKVGDTVTSTLDETRVKTIFGHLRESAAKQITGNPEVVVRELSGRLQLTEDQRGGVLRNLIENNYGRGLNQWALANSVTALANDEPDYDTASHLEALGGRIVSMPDAEWKTLAEAA